MYGVSILNTLYKILYTIHGGVAQLVRASACHAEGRRFEPGRPRQELK